MNKYAINYSVILTGCLLIDAKSKADAFRKFEEVSNSELIDSYDELIEADIHDLNKI